MNFYDNIAQSEILIEKQGDNSIKAEFLFDKNLDIFSGHFPHQSILPGIMQLEMIKFVMQKIKKKSFNISSIKKTKFSSLIRPQKKIYLSIECKQTDVKDKIDIKAILESENKIAGKINMTLIAFL